METKPIHLSKAQELVQKMRKTKPALYIPMTTESRGFYYDFIRLRLTDFSSNKINCLSKIIELELLKESVFCLQILTFMIKPC